MLLKNAQYAGLNSNTQRMEVMGSLRHASNVEIQNAKRAETSSKGQGWLQSFALNLVTSSIKRNLERQSIWRENAEGSLGRISKPNAQSTDARRIETGALLFLRGTSSHVRNAESEVVSFRRITSCHSQHTQSCVMFCRTEERYASCATGKPRPTDGGHIGLNASRNSQAKRMAQEVLAL